VLIFGEITPKTIAKERPEKAAIGFYPFIILCYYVLFPFNLVFSGWKKLMSKIFKFKKEASYTEEELINIVENAEEEGEIEAHESELIRSAIEFEDSEVIDIMVPRVNMVSVEIEDSVEEIYNTYIESGYSRLPVYKNTIDNIVGIIHEKDFYRFMHDGGTDINKIIQKTLCVPASMKISSVLREIQRNKVHLAIVVDEFGGTMGIVTLEDILEELVGEIYDEHDAVEELCTKISDTEYVVAGEQNLEELLETLDITLNENDEEERVDSTTVGGFVTEQMDKIPTVGEKFTFKNLDVEITDATETRVNEVKITVSEKEDEEE
jgi:CBS domain containing-hemolysin-like protein